MYNYISDFIHKIQTQGRYSFTLNELKESINVNEIALKGALHRSAKKERVYSVCRGFYVVIPPEYSIMGMLPASLFINDLMLYIEKPYYVGLLSAAAMHGASHQQPQEYYVITKKPANRTIHAKEIAINFCIKSSLPQLGIMSKKTDTGFINVSEPELTVLDLFLFEKRIGGIGRAASVLSELLDSLDPEKLGKIAGHNFPVACIQRCGYVFEYVLEFRKAADVLYTIIRQRNIFRVPLNPSSTKSGYSSNNRWKVIQNSTIEIEI